MSIFEFYIDKLSEKKQDLWLCPKRKVKNEDPVWYDNTAVGHDTLNNVMKSLSVDAKLSQIYTNHSIRSTSITKLDENNIASRHIQAVSGHKSEATIKTYAKHCPPAKKHQMFDILDMDKSQGNNSPNVKIAKKSVTATVSKPPEDQNINLDFLSFVPIDNNQDDFDLRNMLETIEAENQQDQTGQIAKDNCGPIALQTPNQNQNQVQNKLAAVPVTQQNVPNMVQNVTNNSIKMQPIIPKMIFPYSNVTINYNFSK